MFDIGGWEFLLIGVIAIVVIGPKDLPGTIRIITGWIRRARELAGEFRSGLDDIARDADIDSMKDDLQSGLGLDDIAEAGNSIRNDIEQSIDPGNEFKDSFNEGAEPGDDDDPFLKDYLSEDEDEDDELDDVDPKYRTSETATAAEPVAVEGQGPEEDPGAAEAVPAETVKKA